MKHDKKFGLHLLNSNDQFFRLFCGDLIEFALNEASYVAISFVGFTSYSLAIFCLFHYSPINQLKWLNIFNAIEGKQSFIEQKIFLSKSAKKLIRFSLNLLLFNIVLLFFARIVCDFNFFFFSLKKLSFKHWFLYALPWIIFTDLWTKYTGRYTLASLFITIICYYYQFRLKQIDFYVNWLLKQKNFRIPNQRIVNVLNGYVKIIIEINQFNKFASKVIFALLAFNISTVVFIVYNLIYVNLTQIVKFGHQFVAFGILSLIMIHDYHFKCIKNS